MPETAAEKEFCALGPVAEAFITGAAAAGNTRLGPELAELNTLRAAHGEQEFGAALDRAVAFGRWRAADVRSILAAGPDSPPQAAGDALVLERPSSRSARCRTTPSAGWGNRGRAAAGPRPDRRAAQAETGRDASARPRAAPDREDLALDTGGTAAHPGRGRDQRPVPAVPKTRQVTR